MTLSDNLILIKKTIKQNTKNSKKGSINILGDTIKKRSSDATGSVVVFSYRTWPYNHTPLPKKKSTFLNKKHIPRGFSTKLTLNERDLQSCEKVQRPALLKMQ